jgi:hypothetical protein
MSYAAATDTVLATMLPENSVSADAKADRTGAGAQPGVEEELVVRDINPEMPTGEHIETPPSIDNNVPVVCLIMSCAGSDIP